MGKVFLGPSASRDVSQFWLLGVLFRSLALFHRRSRPEDVLMQ